MARPPLPLKHLNPYLRKLSSPNLPPVKYQILSCQGKEILVGRLKIEIPDDGHAFILRRFDTDALSVTTMFRAAFPTSSDAEERAEIAWVKDNHDLAGNNGSSREPSLTRLAGTWVGPELAMELAESYGLDELVQSMVIAKPDPKGNYRRSHKATAAAAAANHHNSGTPVAATTPSAGAAATATPGTTPTKPLSTLSQKPPSKTLPTPSPTGAPAAKRRKESSPAPSPAATPAAVPPSPSTPKATPGPRRSARTKSPAPSRGPVPLSSLNKPRSARSSVAPPTPMKKEVELPKLGPSPVKRDEDDEKVLEGVAGYKLYEQDMSEQRRLIADLKEKKRREQMSVSPSKKGREYNQDTQMKVESEDEAAEEESEDEEEDEEEEREGPSKLKRVRQDEDEPLKFEFKEPEREERQIATNRRVGRFHMEPRTKSIAWGLAAFAVGMGAVSFLPNFF